MWKDTKQIRKENFVPIDFCDDSTSQMTGGESKELMTDDGENGIGLQNRILITISSKNMKR